MSVAARGLLGGLLLGLLLALMISSAVAGLGLPSFDPSLLGPFRWEEVSPGLA